MFKLTPTEVVTTALILSHKNGIKAPHRENIKEEIYEIDKRFNGMILKDLDISEYINTRIFGKVPYHMYITELGVVVPMNATWYFDECPEPKTESRAKAYLAKVNHPVYGFMFPEKNSLMLIVYDIKKSNEGERKIKTAAEFTANITEKELLSIEKGKELIEKSSDKITEVVNKVKKIIDNS